MNMVDTPTSGLVGTNNSTTGTGNINNLALTTSNNSNPQGLIPVNQGVPSYSGILQNVYSSSSGFGQVVGSSIRRSHLTRAGKTNKKQDPKSVPIIGGGGGSSSNNNNNNNNNVKCRNLINLKWTLTSASDQRQDIDHHNFINLLSPHQELILFFLSAKKPIYITCIYFSAFKITYF